MAHQTEGRHVHRGDSVRGLASHCAGEGHAGWEDDHVVDKNKASLEGGSSR